MNRPSLRYRLRYLWPPNEARLVSRLRMAVLHGALSVDAAMESYRRESWIVTNENARLYLLLPSGAYPLLTFLDAATTYSLLRAVRKIWEL